MNKGLKVIIILIILVILCILCVYKISMHTIEKSYKIVDYEFQSREVKEVYKLYPELFVFDESGVCKMTVEEIHTMQDNYDFEIEHDKDGNMCIGYFIIKKTDNDIEVDSSHICDMINS